SAALPVWWPGAGAGNHRHPYQRTLFALAPTTGNYQEIHTFDSHTGTHLVPPAYALPPKGFDNDRYAPEVKKWLTEYEAKYGPRGTSAVTADRLPIEQTCGPARIIDVRKLVGTTDQNAWPASPAITQEHVKAY